MPEDGTKDVQKLDRVIIRFAGDSGDGMQLTGDRFTSETAALGNDLATLPDFPAEIRAPAGSLPGVSGFQLHFADHDILTPGDQPDVLVAMNPAALKANLEDVPKGGTIIVNTDAFNERNLQKAGYGASPLADGSLADYHLHEVALTSMTVEALKGIDGITSREAERSKNFFALGLMSWLYHRPTEGTLAFIETKFAKRPEIAEANSRAFRAGWNYGETSEDFAVSYEVAPAKLAPGHLSPDLREHRARLRSDRGVEAVRPAARSSARTRSRRRRRSSRSSRPLKRFGVVTIQAEDEIAACGAALGASFGGSLGVTISAGPGRRAEGGDRRARRRARAAVADPRHPARRAVDGNADEARAGRPADGALRSQLGEPGPGDRGVDPVRLLRGGDRGGADRPHLPNARLPPLRCVPRERLRAVADPRRRRRYPTSRSTFATAPNDGDVFQPYLRDPETLARAWAIPGNTRAGAPDRRAGEGERDGQHLVRPRQPRPDGAAARAEGRGHRRRHPGARGRRPRRRRRVLVVGWGSTYGPIAAAVRRVRADGHAVAHAHLRYLNPFPRNTGEVLRRYERVLVPEMNLGQLSRLLRAEYLVDAVGYNRVRGKPFGAGELADAITALVEAT